MVTLGMDSGPYPRDTIDMPIAHFTLQLPAVFTNEGSHVIASFPLLDVSSQGRTREEAAQNLIEATQLFIESCFERNVLDIVLKKCGFKPSHEHHAPDKDSLTVPVELLAAQNGPAPRAY